MFQVGRVKSLFFLVVVLPFFPPILSRGSSSFSFRVRGVLVGSGWQCLRVGTKTRVRTDKCSCCNVSLTDIRCENFSNGERGARNSAPPINLSARVCTLGVRTLHDSVDGGCLLQEEVSDGEQSLRGQVAQNAVDFLPHGRRGTIAFLKAGGEIVTETAVTNYLLQKL